MKTVLDLLLLCNIAYFAVMAVCHLVKKRIWCNILFPTPNNDYFTCLIFLQSKRFLNSFQQRLLCLLLLLQMLLVVVKGGSIKKLTKVM